MPSLLSEDLQRAIRDIEAERIAHEDNGLYSDAVALAEELDAIREMEEEVCQ